MLLVRSKLRSVVDGSEIALVDSDVAGLAGRKLKDSKARLDIFLHCQEKQFILFVLLKSLTTSKAEWKKLKQLYQRSNTESHINLYNQLSHLIVSNIEDVVGFFENCQSILQAAVIIGCKFDDKQVMLLL